MREINQEVYQQWFRDMTFWRRFEDKCRSLYLKQKIRGFLHLYNGQEALPAGFTHAMQLGKDNVITAYRCHVWPMAMGVDPKRVMAELSGKATGTSNGLGGSMHIFSKEHNFYGGHGIVGGQIPLGAGIAFGDKYNKRDAVTICLMGDGAVRQGALHETFNMAMNWKLPVVFVCENNQYAMEPYRTKDELNQYKEDGPIEKVKEVLLSNNWATQAELDEVVEAVKKEVEECVEFAENSPFPETDVMYKHVYEQEDYPFVEN
eukprot:maker-scaffold2479_size15301-snap-gene-0.0 protein:Tk11557 transcript:maker-scaffold2479_size15301-snap-gene-0.0-mRNA-1 annotation:"pyruvate dehydrogenase"